jgi:DNA-binding MarR family transcriptional regulator
MVALTDHLNDKVIHERARLLILTYLASSQTRAVPFTELRDKLDFTAGNLSVQLKTLQDAGYVGVTKEFRDNKPLTSATLTPKGAAALKRYMDGMEALAMRLKKQE